VSFLYNFTRGIRSIELPEFSWGAIKRSVNIFYSSLVSLSRKYLIFLKTRPY
jgi:hypothetical protein